MCSDCFDPVTCSRLQVSDALKDTCAAPAFPACLLGSVSGLVPSQRPNETLQIIIQAFTQNLVRVGTWPVFCSHLSQLHVKHQ